MVRDEDDKGVGVGVGLRVGVGGHLDGFLVARDGFISP